MIYGNWMDKKRGIFELLPKRTEIREIPITENPIYSPIILRSKKEKESKEKKLWRSRSIKFISVKISNGYFFKTIQIIHTLFYFTWWLVILHEFFAKNYHIHLKQPNYMKKCLIKQPTFIETAKGIKIKRNKNLNKEIVIHKIFMENALLLTIVIYRSFFRTFNVE